MKRLCLAALAASLLAAAPAQGEKLPLETQMRTSGDLSIEIVDLTPRFLDFYAAAQGADPETRFAIWQERYGFAALPPTEQGQAMARSMLDSAWAFYPEGMDVIEAGASGLEPSPMASFEQVARVLEADVPVHIRLVAYVGMFENNAFAARGPDGVPNINLPIEADPHDRAVSQAHELVHAVHMELAGLSGGWERSIANTLLSEGLAVHVAREVVPGRADADYIEHQPGWLDRCETNRGAVLSGILPALEASDGQTVFQFTMGDGTTGMQREAYCAGYLVVGQLRDQGMGLAEIARIGEAGMAPLARAAIEVLLDR